MKRWVSVFAIVALASLFVGCASKFCKSVNTVETSSSVVAIKTNSGVKTGTYPFSDGRVIYDIGKTEDGLTRESLTYYFLSPSESAGDIVILNRVAGHQVDSVFFINNKYGIRYVGTDVLGTTTGDLRKRYEELLSTADLKFNQTIDQIKQLEWSNKK